MVTRFGLWVAYSVPNQQWFVMWHSQILSKWDTEDQAKAEVDRLLEGVK